MPSLELGGKCGPGATILVKPALDRKKTLVGSEAVSAKYGTPKCEFICQLARIEGGWVGAHPSIGETAAAMLLATGGVRLAVGASADCEVRREVKRPCGADMRADFVLCDLAADGAADGAKIVVLEVKTVVDAAHDDAAAAEAAAAAVAAVAAAVVAPRVATFPWGRSKQKGPDGEKVVSARAIKHVGELGRIARGDLRVEGASAASRAAILLVVARADVDVFKPNADACPSFARHLRAARDSGVVVRARRLRWRLRQGSETGVAEAFDDGDIPVDLS